LFVAAKVVIAISPTEYSTLILLSFMVLPVVFITCCAQHRAEINMAIAVVRIILRFTKLI
jgi:hypothetical protein